MRRLPATCLLALVLAPIAGCTWSFGHYEKVQITTSQAVAHRPDAGLHVRTRNGSIEVVAAPDQDEVTVDAKLRCAGDDVAEAEERAAAATISTQHDDSGTLVIEPMFPGGARDGDGASLTIRVPGASGAVLLTSNGSVKATGLGGSMRIDTSNGAIVLTDHDGDARLDTSNGPIVVKGLSGALVADTSNGTVKLEGVSGSIEADTSNGPITVVLDPDAPGPLHLDTSNGGISVRVGPAFASEIHLSTSNGRITVNDSSGRVRTQTMYRDHGRLVVGEGGASSRLDTSNGSITLTIEG